nr:retrovirus-related Pol polyprotein from transposon TNT 1-94 [Tanacetum cinerariifolium]
MVEKSKLDEDKEGKAVDPSHYRGMIGTLLYLTASRPDLQFAICMYARYQARPTKKHIHAVENGVIELYFVNTEYQLADLFTKALGRDRIEFLINKLSMRSFTPETLKQLTNEVDETMDMTIDQQVALDEALVPHTSRLRIGKRNFRLRSDITSKESTLQLVYDVLRLTLFYKAFLVTADVPEIYMQELWATATVHHHSIRFKTDNRKRIVNLEYFREMLHICPRLPGQTFDELPFKVKILAFLRFLGHSEEIRKLTDVNINKLHQPWRSFAAFIDKCLSGKSTGYDSLRLSRAQILWGMYHKKNVDYAYLLWEDFVYQVEHKDAKKSNEMYYPRGSVSTRYKGYIGGNVLGIHVKDMVGLCFGNFMCLNQYLCNINNDQVKGAAPPKTKASVRKTKSSSDTTITPPTTAGTRLSTSAKGKQPAKASKAKNKLISPKLVVWVQMKELVPDVPTEESDKEISWKSSDEDDDDDVDEGSDDQDNDDQDDGNDDDQDTDDEGDEFIHPKLTIHEEETKYEESFNTIVQTPENSDDKGNDDENLGLNVGSEEGQDAEDDEDELYRDVNINLEGRDSSSVSSQFVTSMLNPSPDTGIDSLFEPTSQMDVPASTIVASLTFTAPTLTPPTIPTISRVPQAPTPPTTTPSTLLQDLPNFGSFFGFDHRLKTLEANFSEFVQTNQFIGASDRLQDEAQAENEEFLKNLDENIQKIIKEQVKEQVKVQVSKILPKIEKTVNEQLEAEVLTRSSNSSKTSYAVAADLSKMELKKILIEKIESNKSIHRSDEQRNLYKALVKAYESDKIILDTYGDIVTLKRRRDDDADKDEEPSAGLDRGSKRRREGKEPELTSAPKDKATSTTGKSTQGSKSQQKTASESAPAEEPMQTTQDLEEPSHQEFEIGAADDQPIVEDSQHPV